MTKINLSKFDPVDYLKSQEAIETYLQSALETGDADHIASAISDVIRAQGMLQTAKKTGIDRSTLYHSFTSEGGNPRLSTLTKIINSLGLQLSIKNKAIGAKT